MVLIKSGEANFYMDGYLHENLDWFKKAVLRKNTSAVIVVDGRSGMGKTTLSNQVCKFFDENYGLDNIYYEPESFLQGLANAKKGEAFLFDEAMLISSRSALSEINRMIIQAMSMIRSKQIFVIFAVNSIFDLDRNLALHRADMLLHVYGNNLAERGRFCCFFKAKGQEDRIKTLYLMGKKYYSYSKPRANFYGRFYEPFIVDVVEYERRKQIGVNKFLTKSGKQKKKIRDMWLKKAVSILHTDFNLTYEQISEKMECAVGTIHNIMVNEE